MQYYILYTYINYVVKADSGSAGARIGQTLRFPYNTANFQSFTYHMKFQLDGLIQEFAEIETKLADSDVYGDPQKLKTIMQRKKSIEPAVELFREYKQVYGNYEDAKKMLSDERDPDMIAMAKEELDASSARIEVLEEELKLALLPKDKNDEKNIILEVRAGAGGDEAALFARELSNSYRIYAETEGFQLEILDEAEADVGGIKEIVMKISGFGAYSRFKFEAGTHRVQRIPETESKGRVHTSTITVSVLPEADAVDVVIRDEDLDIMACRASGAGGQHVNKTNSAIRVVHRPSGIAVECQDERSQLQNKMKALEILRARVYAMEEEKKAQAIGAARLAQVGTGDRSEKIRTYNYPQDRITDHRIGQNFSNIPVIMQGRLHDIIDALSIADQTAKLEAASGNSAE